MRRVIPATARVVTTGYCPLDLIPAKTGNGYILNPGGTCGNVSVILSHLGHLVTPVIAVGSDYRGARLRAEMREHGIDTSEIVTTAGRGTPAVAQEILPSAPSRHRFALWCPSCGRPFPRSSGITLATVEAVADKVRQSQCLFLDRATPASLRLANLAASTGLLVMFEANHIRPSSRNSAAAESSHVVKYSNDVDSETQRWLPRADTLTQLIVQTLGADGAKYRLRQADRSWGDWVMVPCIIAQFIEDTAGAGDWCSSGILNELLRTRLRSRFTKESIERALQFGQALAAMSVSFRGPQGLLKQATGTQIRTMARAAARSGKARIPASCAKQAQCAKQARRETSPTGNQSVCPTCLG